jgi:DNA-directed RNA polymerase subunit RPC12/RpoP
MRFCPYCGNRLTLMPRPNQPNAVHSSHVYEIRPRKDKRGVDLISAVLPFGRLWYDTPDNAQQPFT